MILIVKESERIPITEKHVSRAGRSGAITIRTTNAATAPNMKHMSNRTGGCSNSGTISGRIDLFSTDTLIDMLARLGVSVRLVLKQSRNARKVA
jgi:hypothetical protein